MARSTCRRHANVLAHGRERRDCFARGLRGLVRRDPTALPDRAAKCLDPPSRSSTRVLSRRTALLHDFGQCAKGLQLLRKLPSSARITNRDVDDLAIEHTIGDGPGDAEMKLSEVTDNQGH